LKHRGFTLLELLVALAIFAVIATLAYNGLNTILMLRTQTDHYANQLAHLQMVFTWLERDIEQSVGRPIRDEYGDLQPALQGTKSSLELTHAGWRNPAQLPRSSLQRVVYVIQGKTLSRTYWQVLDRAQDSQPIQVELLNEVDNLQFRFLDNQFQWHNQWPPLDLFTLPPTSPPAEKIPPPVTLIAIEVTLTVENWGRLIRLFQVTA
jgi:general secretion pathway protein J